MSTKDSFSICCPHSGFSPNDTRGGAIYEYNVLKRMANQGVRLKVILPGNQHYEQFPNMEVSKVRLPYSPHLYNLVLPHYIERFYKADKFDLLKPAYPIIGGPGAVLWRKMLRHNVPMTVTAHHLRTNYLRKVQFYTFRNMDVIIAVAPSVRQEIIKGRIPEERVRFVPNGVDTETFKPQPKDERLMQKYSISSDDFVIGSICGLEPRKRIDLLVRSMREQPKNVKLFIGGIGEKLEMLKEMANDLGVNRSVIFSGYIKKEELAQHYNLFNVFALPTDLDAMPLAILEAMACGKPVIGTNVGAIPFMVEDEKNGYIIRRGDVEALKNRIGRLTRDSSLAKDMGTNSLSRIQEKFTWERCVDDTLNVYKEVIE